MQREDEFTNVISLVWLRIRNAATGNYIRSKNLGLTEHWQCHPILKNVRIGTYN